MKNLIATDAARFKNALIDEILRYDTRTETEEMIVVVVEPPVNTVRAPFGVLDTCYVSFIKHARERAAKVLEKAEKRFRESAGEYFKVTSVLPTGKTGQEIFEAGAKWPADLIAAGSYGRGIWEQAHLSSISNAVTHHAPCNVLVVRGNATTDHGEVVP